ncbi:alpha/beta hydrolase protein [Gonapodya prolifera JEL478]|uniref:Alpha/beta hydrolase protein n=1 Tax=Gonapodya prolifera (strain JEL478) TaxID=1344416 RepID=A0A139ABP5_GONPJ|nr:alpha/beta hydrolase protein [Gonapodya prolifera JEL478]|eukprot:KXS13895.1 alpha/beta hydrolase protein [Gonapodya prolifera JEL478]
MRFLAPPTKHHPDLSTSEHLVGPSRIRTLVYAPKKPTSHPLPAILWIHGGGYILGKPETSAAAAIRFATEVGALVALPTYRLAPEHPAPAALDDCFAVLQWLASGADGLVDPNRIAVGGESAGGGLAAAVAQRAFDEGTKLRSQQLVYPMLDDRTNLPGAVLPTHPGMWTLESNKYAWKSYLGPHADSPEGAPKYAVPGRRENLAGLAETWIGVGTQDLFHAEDIEYSRRLRSAGVRCEVVEVPGAPHGFDMLCSDAPVSIEFARHQVEFYKRSLA